MSMTLDAGHQLYVKTSDSADAGSLNPIISIYGPHPFILLTVSRTIELSLQSSFQLSLTVLVRYRSRGHI